MQDAREVWSTGVDVPFMREKEHERAGASNRIVMPSNLRAMASNLQPMRERERDIYKYKL